MDYNIEWNFYNNNKLLICRKNEKAIYDYNNKLIYETDKEYNEVKIRDKKFIRKTDEMKMEIDFVNSTCKFDFDNEGICTIDIFCELKVNSDSIIIKYNIDEDDKKVIILLKNSEL